jgi:hypothetical protein
MFARRRESPVGRELHGGSDQSGHALNLGAHFATLFHGFLNRSVCGQGGRFAANTVLVRGSVLWRL